MPIARRCPSSLKLKSKRSSIGSKKPAKKPWMAAAPTRSQPSSKSTKGGSTTTSTSRATTSNRPRKTWSKKKKPGRPGSRKANSTDPCSRRHFHHDKAALDSSRLLQIGAHLCRRLLKLIEGLLQYLPVLEALDLLAGCGADGGFFRVLGGLGRCVEDAEVAGVRFVGAIVSGHFVGHALLGAG